MNAFDQKEKIHRMPLNPNVRVLEVNEESNPPTGQHIYNVRIITNAALSDLLTVLQTADPETDDVGFKFSNPSGSHPLPARP